MHSCFLVQSRWFSLWVFLNSSVENSHLVLATAWFIYHQVYKWRQKINTKYKGWSSHVSSSLLFPMLSKLNWESLNTSLFSTEMEMLHFPWILQEATTFQLSSVNPCASVRLWLVTFNCYRVELLSVENFYPLKALSVENFIHWRLSSWNFIRWKLYPLKA